MVSSPLEGKDKPPLNYTSHDRKVVKIIFEIVTIFLRGVFKDTVVSQIEKPLPQILLIS